MKNIKETFMDNKPQEKIRLSDLISKEALAGKAVKEEKVVKKGKASVSEKSKKVAKKDKKKETKAKKVGLFKSIINFFKGVKSEMSKVTWPNKKDMVKYTIASLVFIIFVFIK